MDPSNTTNETLSLLSSISKYQSHKFLPSQSVHPFASPAESTSLTLQDLINTTDQLSNSLALYASASWDNPKLVSLFRQHTDIAHKLYVPAKNIENLVDSLRERAGINYGESIPSDPALHFEWCINKLETWGKLAGMETFKDSSREGDITIMLGGKILVVDVDLSFNRMEPLKPIVKVANVKTSYAIPNATKASNMDGSISLDGFLKDSIQSYYAEVQKSEYIRDTKLATKISKNIVEQLKYLVMLDKLAEQGGNDGNRWFVDVDELCHVLENFAKSEAEVVASSLFSGRAPLDIFLLRSHSLPLPYLTSPSIVFLIHASPSAYLLLSRESPSSVTDTNKNLPQIDLPFQYLRSYVATHPKGITTATLLLTNLSDTSFFSNGMSMPTLMSRPTFPLVPRGSEIEHRFPQLKTPVAIPSDRSSPSVGQPVWILDFTNSGKSKGVVMNQSRLREIELFVNPLSGVGNMGSIGMVSFGTGSWVDLLFGITTSISPERYTALYESPTSAHPPLQLRLAVPEEPGFLLERVPVHSLKEVWGILEIVREQCWLNEILTGCEWVIEGPTNKGEEFPQEPPPSDEDLQAILTGMMIPRKIPVNVFLPTQIESADPLFGGSPLDSMTISQPRRSRIVMTSPERPPMSGLVELTITYDESRPRSILVDIRGAIGADIKLDVMEEIARRGGVFGLPGKVWANSHVSSMI